MRPSVKPVPLPKLRDSACVTMMEMMMLTMGTKYNSTHQTGFPTT